MLKKRTMSHIAQLEWPSSRVAAPASCSTNLHFISLHFVTEQTFQELASNILTVPTRNQYWSPPRVLYDQLLILMEAGVGLSSRNAYAGLEIACKHGNMKTYLLFYLGSLYPRASAKALEV